MAHGVAGNDDDLIACRVADGSIEVFEDLHRCFCLVCKLHVRRTEAVLSAEFAEDIIRRIVVLEKLVAPVVEALHILFYDLQHFRYGRVECVHDPAMLQNIRIGQILRRQQRPEPQPQLNSK